jgi:hypothetical protein
MRKRWVGTFREYDANPETGKRVRRTITFDESVTTKAEAKFALKPFWMRMRRLPRSSNFGRAAYGSAKL